jgi:hypothetical protein
MKKYIICLISLLFVSCLVYTASAQAVHPIKLCKTGRTSRLRRKATLELAKTAEDVRKALENDNVEEAERALNKFKGNPYLINWAKQEDVEALEKKIKTKEAELEEKKKEDEKLKKETSSY